MWSAVPIGVWMIYGWRRSPLHSLRQISWKLCFGDCWLVQLWTVASAFIAGGSVSTASSGCAAAAGISCLETFLQNSLSGNLAPVPRPRPGPTQRDWTSVVCLSCGKAGHSATRCPSLNLSRLCCRDGRRRKKGVVLL